MKTINLTAQVKRPEVYNNLRVEVVLWTTDVEELVEMGGILKAERRGKQHVALSALAGDWRLATNTESNRNCRVSTDQCRETV